jgi:hypothetical protein
MGGAARLNLFSQDIAQAPQGGYMHAAVRQLHVRQGGRRGFASVQCNAQARDQQAVFDGIKPFGAFGVTRAHFVFTAVGVGEVSGHSHGSSLPLEFFW